MCDPWAIWLEMGIQMPCVVQVQNKRLLVTKLVMQVTVVTLCGYLFIHERMWENQVVPTGSLSFWTETGSSHAAGVMSDLQNAKFCDTSRNKEYDYQYGAAFSFTNISCKGLSTREAGIKREAGSFVPTFVQETYVDTISVQDLLGDGICTSECEAQSVSLNTGEKYQATGLLNTFGECIRESASSPQNFFIAGAEDVKVHLEFGAEVMFPTGRERFSQIEKDDNVLVLVMGQHGEVAKKIFPGESVSFKVRELLEFARVNLEDGFIDTKPNQLADATRDHPALRLSGLDLVTQLSCHNRGDRYHLHEHDGTLCYATVQAKPRWNSKPIIDFDVPKTRRGVGSFLSRYNYGVSVKFQITGSFQHLTGSKFFSFLASVIVYMSVPHMVVMFITLWLLGPLSQIYDASRAKRVNIDKLVWGAISRAIHRSLAYDQILELQEKDQRLRKQPITDDVTSHTIERAITKLFLYETNLDPGEIKAMSSSYLGGMDKKGDGSIDRQEFMNYIGSEEICTLQVLGRMFDLDWDRGIVQRMFDPTLKNRLKTLKDYRASFERGEIVGFNTGQTRTREGVTSESSIKSTVLGRFSKARNVEKLRRSTIGDYPRSHEDKHKPDVAPDATVDVAPDAATVDVAPDAATCEINGNINSVRCFDLPGTPIGDVD